MGRNGDTSFYSMRSGDTITASLSNAGGTYGTSSSSAEPHNIIDEFLSQQEPIGNDGSSKSQNLFPHK